MDTPGPQKGVKYAMFHATNTSKVSCSLLFTKLALEVHDTTGQVTELTKTG